MKNSMYSNPMFWAVALIFGGFAIFAWNTGMLPQEVWRFWPIVLILIGLMGIIGFMDSPMKSNSSSKTVSKPAAKKVTKKARR